MLRSRHIFLVPGDSPAGFRLPLKSLVVATDDAKLWPLDPMSPRGPLPQPRLAEPPPDGAPRQHQNPQSVGPDDGAVRTALTVEARKGCLCAFLPPLARAERCSPSPL